MIANLIKNRTLSSHLPFILFLSLLGPIFCYQQPPASICQILAANTTDGDIYPELKMIWNDVSLNKTDIVIYLAFCPVLLFFQILVTILFYRYPTLLIKPGNILFTLVIIQMGLNLHLLGSAIYHTIVNVSYLQLNGLNQYRKTCNAFGIMEAFLQTGHLIYLFTFLLYIIFLFRFSLKKKSQNFWRILHIVAFAICGILTFYFYYQHFIGPNLYGLCGFTPLIKYVMNGKTWNIIMPSFQVFFCTLFLLLGLYTYVYFKKHMPEQGQLKSRKANYNRVILVFVCGFSFFQLCMALSNLILAIDCQRSSSRGALRFMVTFVNIIRPIQYAFTVIIILLNAKFRRRFKMLLKNILSCKCLKKDKNPISSMDDSRRGQIEMQEIVLNQKLLSLKDRSYEIDLLFISQIFTIISGVYAFFFEYFQSQQSKIEEQVKHLNFKEHITIQIDSQSMKNYEFQTRLLVKVKILRCRFTLHCPKVFQKLLKLDGLQNVHQSFKIMDNIKRIFNLADGQGGKSGQFFFFSSDRKYVLKTVTVEQFEFLKSHLHHFYEYYRKNPKSVLAKIYGLFTIRGDQIQRTYQLILMKNITGCSQTQIARVYDMKGSKYDRQVIKSQIQQNQLSKITLKDLDFLKYQKRLKISQQISQQLRQVIRQDAHFLKQLTLIDYSLLVVKVKWPQPPQNPKFWHQYQRIAHQKNKQYYYHIGIIDYLQLWDLKKKSESWWKKLLGKTDISAIDPLSYCNRFLSFIQQISFKSNRKQSQESQKESPLQQIKYEKQLKQLASLDKGMKIEQLQIITGYGNKNNQFNFQSMNQEPVQIPSPDSSPYRQF